MGPLSSARLKLTRTFLRVPRLLPFPRGGREATSEAHSSSLNAVCNDTLIIGGGPIGSSTAFHLAKARGCDGRGINVVERDPTYASSSATSSAGSIRQQFSLKENVLMSLYGRDFLRGVDVLLRTSRDEETVDVQFQEHGYLFLAGSEAARGSMVRNNAVQRDAGADIVLLDRNELEAKFPWLNSKDVLMGSYGAKGEGWFDPWSLICALKKKNLEMGVQYIHGSPVGAKRDGLSGKVKSIDVKLLRNDGRPGGGIAVFNSDRVVNAAGAHASPVMDMLAGPDAPLRYPLPVRPRKRCMFYFHCSASEGIPPIAPLTVDASLCYFRSEGSGENATFLCGMSPTKEEDKDCYDEESLQCADHHLFDDRIWPALYHRVPAFGEIKVRSSWAGLYEYNTVDQNAIIGPHPEMENVFMACGFSGHGLQHSPAAGRAVAEIIDHGKFDVIDLSIFCFDRFVKNRPVFEEGIV